MKFLRRLLPLLLAAALAGPASAATASLENQKRQAGIPFDGDAAASEPKPAVAAGAGRSFGALLAPSAFRKHKDDPPAPALIRATKYEGSQNWLNHAGRTPYLRDLMAVAANAFGGFLDRTYNNRRLAEVHKKTPIPNLRSVDGKVLRGGGPSPAGWRLLKEKGVGLAVNLRYEDNSEAAAVRELGMEPFYLAIPDTDIPTPKQVLDFFAVLELNKDKTVYIHCAAGEFRTATMVGLYRLFHGASYEDVLKEAVSYGFDPEWMRGYRERQLLKNFSRGPRRWLELASRLPDAKRRRRGETLLILP